MLSYPSSNLLMNGSPNGISINTKSNRDTMIIDLSSSKWFFVSFVGLLSLAILNLALTTYIISTLQLGQSGVGDGDLLLLKKGITIKRNIEFNGVLSSQLIQSSGPMAIESPNGFELEFGENKFKTERNELDLQTKRFLVKSADNQIQFDISTDELTTSASGPLMRQALGGHKMTEKFEASVVQGPLNNDFRIESRTGSVLTVAEKDMTIESQAGDQDIAAFADIEIGANRIRFETKKVEIRGLKFSTGQTKNGDHVQYGHQLCTCGNNGRVFAAPPIAGDLD